MWNIDPPFSSVGGVIVEFWPPFSVSATDVEFWGHRVRTSLPARDELEYPPPPPPPRGGRVTYGIRWTPVSKHVDCKSWYVKWTPEFVEGTQIVRQRKILLERFLNWHRPPAAIGRHYGCRRLDPKVAPSHHQQARWFESEYSWVPLSSGPI